MQSDRRLSMVTKEEVFHLRHLRGEETGEDPANLSRLDNRSKGQEEAGDFEGGVLVFL